MASRTDSFVHGGHRLVYDEYGAGPRAVLLMPGLLFSRKMHRPLATALAERGHRVICLDLLGHGDSDRPKEMWEYSMPAFGAEAIALLDHLEIERAVLGGPSLGANSALEAAALDQSRVQGLLIAMPVLDNALLGCAIGFTPLLVSLTFGAPVTRPLSRAARLVPRWGPLLGTMALDWVSQDPKPSASLLQGLFFGRVAPPTEIRRTLEAETLVIGHPRDPIHPFSDADMLVHELPNAHLIEADSIVEMWTRPDRLTAEIERFVDRCWRRRRGRVAPAAAAH
ncbi:MAG: alpha/beta hydrolase [Solirubrobacterales bacterium]|nr:alpha/beta hydrolase [Solirubrobacterales bacterium]